MNVNLDDFQPMTGELPASVHMIGTGGAGMSGIARVLLARGIRVTGSDVKEPRAVVEPCAMGTTIAISHDRANLELAGEGELPEAMVTFFAAIPKTNSEPVSVHELDIPVLRRSDVLTLLVQGSRALLIAGTHGKTSTTSMTVAALQAAGLDPSFAVGGLMSKAGVNTHQGSGDVSVAEADESDVSLLIYQPEVAVITNIEPDHLDFFGDDETYCTVFDTFAERIKDGGHLVVCAEDPHAAALGECAVGHDINVLAYGGEDTLIKHSTPPVGAILYGWAPVGGGTRVEVTVGSISARFELHQPSRHMVLNTLAAMVGGDCVGADLGRMARGLGESTGVRRRFDYRGSIGEGPLIGARIYSDYAHHPTEVSAVLGAARELVTEAGRGNVIAVSQPHLYSRTRNFADEFAAALSLADKVVLFDVFGAREELLPGVDGTPIANKMIISVTYESHFTSVPARVYEITEPRDVVLTISAGSVTMLADEIIRELSGDNDG